MKPSFLTTLLLLVSHLSFGQLDSTDANNKQFQTYYGLQVPNVKELNTVLNMNDYPQLNLNNFSVGLGTVKFTKKKFIVQQEIFVYSQTKKNDTVSTSIKSINYGQSVLGYSYVYNAKFKIYSLLGITYFNTTVKVAKEIPSSTQFNNYASTIGNLLEMKSNQFIANVTTHINYSIKIPNTKNRLILGIRGAYYFSLDKSKWLMSKTKLDNGPNINPGGYAVNFVLGFSY